MLGGLQLNIKRQILVVYKSMGKFGPPAFQDARENKLPAKILDEIGAFNEALNMLDFLFELKNQFRCGPWKCTLQVPRWPLGFQRINAAYCWHPSGSVAPADRLMSYLIKMLRDKV